ncbi:MULTISPECIES: recombinase family protein [unclassified Marinovum]
MIIKAPSSPKKKQCILYLRVSSAKQTSDGAGLSSQERSCREYADHNGYEVVEIFTDVISGRYADRPGMNELLAFLRAAGAKPYIVVVDDITRRFATRSLRAGQQLKAPTKNSGKTQEADLSRL